MSEWKHIESEAGEEFCRIEYFGIKKRQGEEVVEFIVTVREYFVPPDPAMPFFAMADKHVNQKSVAYQPCGWGSTSNEALWECLKAIRKFPYEPA